MQYFIVPQNIVDHYQGFKVGNKGLYFVQDAQGRYVVNIEVAESWQNIDWQSMQIVELTEDDFPKPETE